MTPNPTNNKTSTLFSVYLSQGGSSINCILDQESVDALYEALHKSGQAVSLWLTGQGYSTVCTVHPRRGGFTLNMRTAEPIAIDAQGNPAQTQEQHTGWLKPEDQPRGAVAFPEWADEAIGGGDDNEEALELLRGIDGQLQAVVMGLASTETGTPAPAPPPKKKADPKPKTAKKKSNPKPKMPAPKPPPSGPVVDPPSPTTG